MPNTAPPFDQKTINIFTAVKEGNLDKLKEYIKNKGDINIKYDNGRTLLHEAVLFTGGDQHSFAEKRNVTKGFADHKNTVATSMVEALLDAGASPKIIDAYGNGPLIYAIARSIGNYITIPKMLLEKGADANKIGYVRGNEAGGDYGLGFNKSLPFTEKTPLVLALTANRLRKADTSELMRLLCEKGANTSSLYEFLESAKKYVSGGAGVGVGGIADGGAGDGASRKIGDKLSLKLNHLLSILPELEETYPNTKFTDYDIKGALETICEKVGNKVGNKSKVDSKPGPKSTAPSRSHFESDPATLPSRSNFDFEKELSILNTEVERLECVTALLVAIYTETPQPEAGPSKRQRTGESNGAASSNASGATDAPTQSQHREQIPTEATMRLPNPPASTGTRERSDTPPSEQIGKVGGRRLGDY